MKCSWNILEVWFLKTQTFVLSVFWNYLDCFSCFGKVSPCCWLNPEEILFGTIVIQFKLNPREMGLLWRAGGGSVGRKPSGGAAWLGNFCRRWAGPPDIKEGKEKTPSLDLTMLLPEASLPASGVNRVFVIAFFCFCQRQNLTLQLSPQICGRPTSGGATTPKS